MQVAPLYSQYNNRLSVSLLCNLFNKKQKLGRIFPDERKRMKILNIETRYYDNCNLINLNYSTLYSIIVFGVIYHDMNFKDITNCINSNDCLVDCLFK